MTVQHPEIVQPSYRGRFAPSPTGALHLGSLLAAVASWLRARSQGGAWLVRIEDIDPPRERPGASAGILATLADFGLASDEPVLFQSTRAAAYQAALDALVASGQAFPCHCSRQDVRARGGHHGPCAPDAGSKSAPAWRLRVPAGTIGFEDRLQGPQSLDPAAGEGDFVLRRSDGLWAYQLAVVVDDHAQGITEVVRGSDLLDSTPRQIVLQQALRLPTPGFLHLPVLLDDDGRKLSKQHLSMPVDGGDPLPALRQVLALLGVPPALRQPTVPPARLLADAVGGFEIGRLPGGVSLRSAAWRAVANR
ncbi:MAG: tRNA glutamyl-Q(34) synthetase GluQRS [Xanthomonadales bacterium]|nr:tRNA glutamyl-Q(34) synthetase GluQRS [Xanthomonadales bacterium]